MKVLILSVKAGYGHHSTGQALMDYFKTKNVTCTMLDTFEYINPILGDSISDGYLLSTKYFPDLYGRVYGRFDRREERYDKYSLMAVLSKMVSHKLKEYVCDYAPDVVIGTHSYACMLMTYLREKGQITCPTYGIVTDFTVHPFWESTDIDYYVTPTQLLNRQMMRKGIPAEKILPFGIPVRPAFAKRMPKQEARELLGIENKKTILMMMGSMGFGNLVRQLAGIDALAQDVQVLCVCGNNEKAKKNIEKLEKSLRLPYFCRVCQQCGYYDGCGRLYHHKAGRTNHIGVSCQRAAGDFDESDSGAGGPEYGIFGKYRCCCDGDRHFSGGGGVVGVAGSSLAYGTITGEYCISE